ncbi:MAG: polysaccharide biosynthesis protein [Verrucomicrobiota bacterium]|nr:polysaccharide biosynthesis protein [Verrucomicrobiota bacterium]
MLGYVLRNYATRTVALTFLYAAVLAITYLLAFELRFDFDVPAWLTPTIWSVCAITVGTQLICMFVFDQFDGLLSYFSRPDLKRLVFACTLAAAVLGIIRLSFGVYLAPPRGVLLIDYMMSIGVLSGMRLSFRRIRLLSADRPVSGPARRHRIAIFGAGDCGAMLARECLSKPWLGIHAVAFFDDKRSRASIHGVPVLGAPEGIAELKEKLQLDELIIADPSASPKRVRDVVKLARESRLPCRTVPSMDQLATGQCSVTNLRPIAIQDLLGRDPVEVEGELVREVIEGRTVLVTGAGGSIGSELCRQIMSYDPAALVFLDRSEPQLFVIEQELRARNEGVALTSIVADIARPNRMRNIFRCYRPQVVFHAAAHKHVPLMELQPEEAIYNNIFGTALVADLASEFKVERFVLISSDKAVNPTNVMGATKRAAELYVQSLATKQTQTKFMAVRFGNVLGSSGSVVPTFERQIANGGPITVTHPDVTRFFMTISEAVSLVLQSSALGKGGDIFVLDMGKPVRIVDLALQMIALAGLTPHQDIEIAFTGLRPGEKLYEELSHGGEQVTSTVHPKIARMLAPPLPHSYIAAFLRDLMQALDDGTDGDGLKQVLAKTLPDYRPAPKLPPLAAPPLLVSPLLTPEA